MRMLLAGALLAAGCTSTHTLVLTVEGHGAVSSLPAGVDCDPHGGSCRVETEISDPVVLTPTATETYAVFDGWSGACEGTAECRLAGDHDVAVTATFHDELRNVSLMRRGSGSYLVTSEPAGISCGTDPTGGDPTREACNAWFPAHGDVLLLAQADHDSYFIGWDEPRPGCDTGAVCHLVLDENRTIGATFSIYLAYGIKLMGTGMGTITGTGGLHCPSICYVDQQHEEMVTLHAEAAPGSVFTGWVSSPPCTPATSPDCTFLLQNNGLQIYAQFDSI